MRKPAERPGGNLEVHAVAIGLALLAVAYFWPVLGGGKVLWPADMVNQMQPWRSIPDWPQARPYNPLLDPIQQFWPWRKFAASWMQHGQLPLWNPLYFCGAPFLAQGQSALLYPLNVIYWLMGAESGAGWAAALHVWLAAFFTFLWLRRRTGPVPGLLGGLAFAFCGFFAGWLEFPTFLSVGVWLPLGMLAVDLVVERRRLRWAALLAVAVGMPFLGGHLQITTYVIVALGLYAIWQLFAAAPAGQRRRAAALLLIGAAAGAFVAMPQALPTLEYARVNVPKGGAFRDIQRNALQPQEAALAVLPNLFGNPVDYNHWGSQAYPELSFYLGIVTLVLAVAGAVAAAGPLRWFLLALAGLALLAALGTPVAMLMYYLIPGFKQIAGLPRIMFLWDFALAGLAALGLQALIERRPRAALAASLASGAVVLIALVAWQMVQGALLSAGLRPQIAANALAHLPRHALTACGLAVLSCGACLLCVAKRAALKNLGVAAAVMLLAIDLLPFSRRLAPMVDGRALTSSPPSLRYLQVQASGLRVISVGPDFMNIFPPNLQMAWGIASPFGSDSFCPRWQGEVLARLGSTTQGAASPSLTSKVADFLAARFVLTALELPSETGLVPIGKPDAYLYARPKARPRATLVSGVQVAPGQAALAALFDPRTDLSATVVLEKGSDSPPASAGAALVEQGSPNLARVYCLGTKPGWLVLADTFYAGWRAFVDGKSAPIERADYAYRAVPVGAGPHKVVMAFYPATVAAGLFLAGLGLAVICALLAARVEPAGNDA